MKAIETGAGVPCYAKPGRKLDGKSQLKALTKSMWQQNQESTRKRSRSTKPTRKLRCACGKVDLHFEILIGKKYRMFLIHLQPINLTK
ncbi:MAG: hypothetical protein IPG99_10055 [Ignavibacteria bacterium]|nr:hypothetical protein [Ignavibacteria bacterium]